MSQTTRCPSCHTCFRVVADQLRISDGWVRCGQCSEVFDATDTLESQAPVALLPDMDMQNLRGPVERVPAPSATQRAWQNSCLQPSPARTVVGDPPDVPLLPTPMARPVHSAEFDRDHGLDVPDTYVEDKVFYDESLPDFENTVPAEMWALLDLDPPALVSVSTGLENTPRVTTPRSQPAPQQSFFGESSLSQSQEPASLGSAAPLDSRLHSAGRESLNQASSEGAGSKVRNFVHPLQSVDLETAGEVRGKPGDFPSFGDDQAQSTSIAFKPLNTDSEHRSEDASDESPGQPDLSRFIAEFTDWKGKRQTAQGLDELGLMTAHDPLSSDQAVNRYVQQTLPEDSSRSGDTFISRSDESANWPSLDAEGEHPAISPVASQSRLQDGYADGNADSVADADAYPAASVEPVDSKWEEQPEPLDVREPSFVLRARRRAFWSSTAVRVGLFCVAFLLLALLASQSAVHHRDALAARFPELRTTLTSLCAFTQCVVEPQQNIGAILVDASSFNRIQGDRYQFLLTLRNRSKLEVRAPVVELTLTDVQDQPLVRRILRADELRSPQVFKPQQEWNGEIPMVVAPGATRIAGYRVLAFYPN